MLLAHPDLDVNQQDTYGRTFLHFAAYAKKSEEYARVLFETRGGDVDLTKADNKGLTPVILAKAEKREKLARLLASRVENA